MKKILCLLLAVMCVLSFSACSKKTAGSSLKADTTAVTSGVSSEKNEDKTTSETKKEQKLTTQKAGTTKNSSEKKTTAATKKTTTKKNDQTTKKTVSATKKATTSATVTKKTTVSVRVTVDYTAALSSAKKPDDLAGSGYFLSGFSVTLSKGSSAYNALRNACSNCGVSLVASQSMYGMYISSIGGLSEKECGNSSGWTYTVNGSYPSRSCDKTTLSDGDNIKFIYKV